MKLAKDKTLHFNAGLALAIVFGAFFGAIVGLLLAVAAGVGKEVYDYYTGKGTPELADVMYTWLGGVVGFIITLLLM